MRGWALSACLLASAVLAETQVSPTRVSANDNYAIRFEYDKETKACRIVGVREESAVWTLTRCLGTVDDWYLISNDGARFWILKTLPSKPPEPVLKKRPRTPPAPRWWGVTVAEEWDRKGNKLRSRSFKEFVPLADRWQMVQLEKHFKWLEGVLGVRGRQPRVNEKNQVEFEVMGGQTITLDF